MNILFLIPYVPNRIRVRPYNLIRSLSSLGHRITILTLWTDDRELEDLKELHDYCADVQAVHLQRWRSMLNSVMALPTDTPLQANYCWQPELAQKLAMAVSKQNGKPPFDVVHIEHLRGSRYGLFLKSHLEKSGMCLPIIWDSVDSISLLFRQAAVSSERVSSKWLSRFELGRTENYEAKLLNWFDHVLVTSTVDKQAMLSLVGNKQPLLSVLPNGVDLSNFKPNPELHRDPATIVLSGKMSYHANVSMVLHFVREIMPQVWSKRNDVKVWVVGKDPTRELKALTSNPAIEVTGMVKDLAPYLQRATIAATPVTYGAGVQNKVLEAMACATPVVSSPQAISALDLVPGQDVFVAQSPNDFANAILHLLENKEEKNRLGCAGYSYVKEHHQWSRIAAKLEGIYRDTSCSIGAPLN